MRGVAIQHWAVSVSYLTRVVHNDNLGHKVLALFGRILLRVGGDEPTLKLLYTDVLDVEAHVVTRKRLGKRLVVHFHGLDLSGQTTRGETNNHSRLNDTGFHSAYGHCSNTTNFVDVLQRQAQRLVRRPLWWLYTV